MGGGYRSSQTDTLSAKQLVSRLAKRVVAINSRQMAPTNPPSDEKMEEKMEEEKKKQTTTKEKSNPMDALLGKMSNKQDPLPSSPPPAKKKKQQRSKKLKTVVEMMANSMSTFSRTPPYEVLAQVFLRSDKLEHLDLSYCKLHTDLVHSTLSSSLKNNHTLMGIHLHGNSLRIDPRGYLQLGTATMPHTMTETDLSGSTLG
jgi:hypothetical protein